MPSDAPRPGLARRLYFQSLRLIAGERRAANTAGQVRAEELLEEALGELRAVLAELTE